MPKPPHACPCGCGRQIPHHRYSCPGSWQRLPEKMKRAIVDNRWRDPAAYRAARLTARLWLRGEDPRCEFRYPGATGGRDRRCGDDKAEDSRFCEQHEWAES